MKKTTAVFLVFALMISALTGCGGASADEGSGLSGENQDPQDIYDTLVEMYPWMTRPSIDGESFETDLKQTGRLVICSPYPSWTNTLTPVVELYKKIYPNVEVFVENTGNDVTAYGPQVSVALMAGKGPDILFPRYMYNEDIFRMIDAGVLQDLNELMEQDESFNLDGYVKPIMDGSVVHSGQRYFMPYSYLVSCYLSIPSKLDEIGFDSGKTSDTLSFINEVVRTLPEAKKNPGFNQMLNTNLLSVSLITSGIRCVDRETKTALPDEDLLEAFMKAYKPYYLSDTYTREDNENKIAAQLNSGQILFGEVRDLTGFVAAAGTVKKTNDFQVSVIRDINGKIPTFDVMTIAVRAGTPNRQNAWNFIKLMLSPENQSRDLFQYIPVHIDSIYAVAEIKYRAYYDGGRIAKLNAEEMDAYLSIITNVSAGSAYMELPYWGIAGQYMDAYLKDEMSYDDCAARVKNDLMLYLSE